MENPIFKYTIKSSGRSAEEEYEMVSARRDNTDLDKPPSQLQNQRKSPDDMRPKPPKSAPQGGQNNFMRYSLKSNLDLSNKVPGTAREKEQEKTSSVMPHSARPNSAKEYRLRRNEGPILVVKPATAALKNRLPKLNANQALIK